MKVLLLEPLIGSIVFPGMARFNVAYPLLAAVLRQNGVDVKILDPNAEELDWKGLARAIREEAPDVVGLGCNPTAMAYRASENIDLVKEVNPEIVTVGGGIFFGGAPEEAFRLSKSLDYIVVGEGEATLLELVRELEKKKPEPRNVRGIAFRESGQIVYTPARPVTENLDDLPFPAYDLAPVEKLKSFFWFYERPEDAMIMVTSRGCPWNCIFCSQWKFYGRRWRAFSAKRVVDEVEFLNKEYGKSYFVFGDDLFNLDRQRLEDFAGLITSRGLDIRYSIEARMDLLLRDRDIMGKLVSSGLNHVIFGFDATATEESLRDARKGLTLEQIREGVRMFRDFPEVALHCFVVLGNRKDSRDGIRRTVDFLREICPDVVFFWTLTPFPGTDLWASAQENSWIEERNLSKYDEVHPIMPTETLSRKELRELIVESSKAFYSSPEFGEKLRDPAKRAYAGFFYDAWVLNNWTTPDLYKAFGASVRRQMAEDRE